MGFHTKIVGVTHDNPDGTSRQAIIAELTMNTPIRLERDLGNFYDPNAVRIVDAGGRQLGFLNRSLSEQLAPRMDAGETIRVSISALTGGGNYNRGVNIFVDA
ncbi:MAG TPA: HIRAN domain-containing protein [bacterium]|nr:HIRAN domain-containing protein [bacterium]